MWVISSFLLIAGGALCQSERAAEGLRQRGGSNSLEVRHQEMRDWKSLPDAPSTVQPPTQAEKAQALAYEAHSTRAMHAAGIPLDGRRGTELRHVPPVFQPRLIPSDELRLIQKESSNFIVKYLCPPLVKRGMLYQSSTRNTLIGRASYAASHIFVTRDDSGKQRLNTAYFLRVLSLVAVHDARRPYWARSASAPFNDLGSTIGNDAGISLFREFEPGIRQMVKGYTPKFALKIEERITRDPNPKEVASSPAR